MWTGKACFWSKPDIAHRRMIAVAGAIAEACWFGKDLEDVNDEFFWFESEVMSDSDWAYCNCAKGEPTPELMDAITAIIGLFES